MTKKEQKKAICIGAGFGGIAIALRLKALGYQVLLVDRAKKVGGRAQVYQNEGFKFDAGPTVITAPFLFEELFALFGKKIEEYVQLIPLKIWYRYLFEDGRRLDIKENLEETLLEIKAFNERDVLGYQNLLGFTEKIYNIGFEQLSSKPFSTFFSMVKTLPSLLRLKSYQSVYKLISTYIEDDSLRRAFSISPLLVGGNPFNTTSIYALIHALERKSGVHFPKGGTGALVEGLKRLMEEENIQIELNTTVKKICIENGKAIGILTDCSEFKKADLVVVNGDPSYVYKNMIEKTYRKKWSDKRIEGLKYSMGLFVLYFGCKKRYEEVAHHTIIFGKSYKSLLKEIFEGEELPEEINLYIHRPTATDPEMADEGRDSFYALAPVPNLKATIDWDQVGEIYKEKLLDLIDKKLLSGLRENLVTSFFVTPKNFEADYLSYHGTGFSIAPLFSQSAFFRFHNQSEDVQSLYFVGAGTHPGAGLPGVLSSAKVVEEILKSKERV